jgi:hypothetical protein
MSGVKSGIRTDDVTKINNIVSPDGAVKGTSLPDVQAQEIKKIGVPPVQETLKKSSVEKEKEEHDHDPFSESDSSRALLRDANARATKLVDLEGMPE